MERISFEEMTKKLGRNWLTDLEWYQTIEHERADTIGHNAQKKKLWLEGMKENIKKRKKWKTYRHRS